MNITVVGVGHVGLANAIALSQNHHVTALDISCEKIEQIQQGNLGIDKALRPLLADKLHLCATLDKNAAYQNADFVMIATPTDYDPVSKAFNTQSIESVIHDVLALNPTALIIIRSTIPIGFTTTLQASLDVDNIIFAPEFLREGYELYDCLYPSRIIVGEQSTRAQNVAQLLIEGAQKKDTPIHLTGPKEAEAIKLFANTYLAMRVAYFNELDSYATVHHLNTQEIITGVCLDDRIGHHYNNPSFGYGGYCLPKDTKQLFESFANTPQCLMQAIVKANDTRTHFIVNDILKRHPTNIGIYRLTVKTKSQNCRHSIMFDVLSKLKTENAAIHIYEPILDEITHYEDTPIIKDLDLFKEQSDIIITNRMSHELMDVKDKVYTRDLFQRD